MAVRSQPFANTGRPDYVVTVVVAALAVFGLIMVFSASFVLKPENPTFYLVRQVLWLALGLAAMTILTRIDYRSWQRWSVALLAAGLGMLIVVLVTGGESGGGQRWLVGSSIQPSELVKVIMIVYIANWLASKGTRIRQVSYGLVPFAILIGIVTSLIVLQPNMSSALLITGACSLMFFVAGADLFQLLISGAVGSAVIAIMIWLAPYRLKRVVDMNFLFPLQYSQDSGYQITQALLGMRSGGWFGVGLGGSQVKFGTPFLWHTDTIFAVIVEELGMVGALVIIFLFGVLAWRGLRIAQRAPDAFGSYLATGITTWITLQALINLAVVTAVLPPTGVTLPFISYGGSSLIALLMGVGLLLSVSRRARTAVGSTYAYPDIGWRDRGARVPGPGSA